MQTRELYLALVRKVELYEKLFAEFTQKLCTSGLIEEAYLVGSRAHGENIPSSDFDVVFIVSGDADPLDAAVKIRLLKRENIPLDIVVLKRSDLEDPLYRETLRNAKRIC